MNILALDPSILHLGWACMTGSPTAETILHQCGTIKAPTELKAQPLAHRIYSMLYELNAQGILDPTVVDKVVIEQPEPWGAYKSLASAQSGSLQKLTLITGALVGWAFTWLLSGPDSVVLVKVSTWKGQLPKGVTKKRMEKKYSCTFATSDEADAVGLGDWYLERERSK